MNSPGESPSTPLEVLLLARELDLGGSERQLAVTALGLDRALFHPHVACFRGGGFRARELKRAEVPVLELGVRSLVSRSAFMGRAASAVTWPATAFSWSMLSMCPRCCSPCRWPACTACPWCSPASARTAP